MYTGLLIAGFFVVSQPQGAATVERIVVTAEHLTQRPVDIKQGGQFIEPLCNLIPSMLAQQVAGDSFEEEPPYNVAYKADLDKPFRPWFPDGAVHKAAYSFDTEHPFNGKRSQKVEINARCRAGISQDGLSLKEGLEYTLRLHARSVGERRLYVSLHGDGAVIAGPETVAVSGEEWATFELRLKASRTCDDATLTIEGEGPGTFWLDRVSVIGADAVLGIWRADVVEALQRMNPGCIRWGGSTTEGYEWEKCLGPWDARAPFTTCWGGLEPNFVGMEEFVQLCRYVDAEPLLCIRWSGRSPEDAAAQVEYFNGAPDSLWGKKRAENGHPEPYGVKYWQIGNEVGGRKYDDSVEKFAEAMRKVDPGIKICSAFLTDDTLAKGGDYLDYLCPHHYGCEDLVGKENEFKHIRDLIARDGMGRDVRVAVTEWNTTAGDWGLGRGTLQTLSNALSCARYQNLMHRYADLVEISMRSNLVDSFGSGVIQTGPGWMYLAPAYYGQQLYQRAAGAFSLKLERAPEARSDVSVLQNAQGDTVYVYAVNQEDVGKELLFDVSALGAVSEATLSVLRDSQNEGSGEVMNTRDAPARIAPETRALTLDDSTMLRVMVEPLSLVFIEAHVK